MFERFKKFWETVDFSDIRLMLLGCLLILLPLFYLFFFAGVSTPAQPARRILMTDISRQSAFNLTSLSKTPGQTGARTPPAVSARVDQVEAELDKAWQKIQSIPKVYNLPPGLPVETRQMIEAEDDPDICEGNSLLDRCDFDLAEKHYRSAINNAADNHFKELFAWGGLMEIYQLQGNIARFKEAFANYAKTAQKLKHVYGPLADDVTRAFQMLEQMQHVDSGKLREYLTRANLETGNRVSYEDFMKSINHTKEWFPGNLTEPPGSMPEMMRPGSGG